MQTGRDRESSVATRRPRASVHAFARGVVAVCGAAWVTLFVALGFAWLVRATPPDVAIWFDEASTLVTVAAFVVFAWAFWRLQRVPLGWSDAGAGVVASLVSGVLVPVVALLGLLHVEHLHGDPTFDCSVEGMVADDCVGRDFGGYTNEYEWIHARGALTESVCAAFSTLDSTSTPAPIVGDAWDACALSNARAFARIECSDTGFRSATRCSRCSHPATFGGTVVTEVAWTPSCASAEVFQSTNVRSKDLPACRDAIRPSECPQASIESPGPDRGALPR